MWYVLIPIGVAGVNYVSTSKLKWTIVNLPIF